MSQINLNPELMQSVEILSINNLFNNCTTRKNIKPAQQTLLKNNLFKKSEKSIIPQPANLPFDDIIAYETVEKPEINQLFYCNSNSIKPIVSTNMSKSGIFRSASAGSTAFKTKDKDKYSKNVYYSAYPNVGGIVPIVNQQVDSQKIYHRIEILPVPIETVQPPVQSFFVPHNFEQLKYMTGFLFKIPRDGNYGYNSTNDSIIYEDPVTEKKTTFHIINPSTFNLQYPDLNETELKMQNNKMKRDQKNREKRIIKYKNETPNTPEKRTYSRYGRLSKPPKQLKVFFDNLKAEQSPVCAASASENSNQNSVIPNEILEPPVNPINNSENTIQIINNEPSNFPNIIKKRERRIHDDYRCSTCNRIYLGENKMARHLELNPDHNKNLNSSDNKGSFNFKSKLYEYLIEMSGKCETNEEREKVFLKEISNFVKTLQYLRMTLFHNNNLINGNQFESSQYIDNNIKYIMKLNNHNYSLNMTVLNDEINHLRKINMNHEININVHSNSNDKITNEFMCNLANDSLISLNVDDIVNELNTTAEVLRGSSSTSMMDTNKILNDVTTPPILDLTDLFTT